MSPAKTFGQVEVSFSFLRHIGPTFIHGAVTLDFADALTFSFISKAVWPSGVNYDSAIEDEIRSTIQERGLRGCRVVLKSVAFDQVHSSEVGFRKATRAAALSALEV